VVSPTLRFWESASPFVVLGVGQVAADEVHLEACRTDSVPVFRRCSAGGCVLQGPGSLNFTLALTFESCPEVRQLKQSYCVILHALEDAFARAGVQVKHRGICDLAMGDQKVSGNAQRRRRTAMLHHGTLLHAVDFDVMERYLRMPQDRPDYRGERSHRDFIRALPCSADALRDIVRDAFRDMAVESETSAWERERAEALMREKYADPAWNFRR